MPNIKPVSDLRNYTEVLLDIAVGEPVFLSRNRRGKSAILIYNNFTAKSSASVAGEVEAVMNSWRSVVVSSALCGNGVSRKLCFRRKYTALLYGVVKQRGRYRFVSFVSPVP
jgi:hypothetical protein